MKIFLQFKNGFKIQNKSFEIRQKVKKIGFTLMNLFFDFIEILQTSVLIVTLLCFATQLGSWPATQLTAEAFRGSENKRSRHVESECYRSKKKKSDSIKYEYVKIVMYKKF